MKYERGSRNLEINKSHMFKVFLFLEQIFVFSFKCYTITYFGELVRTGVEGEVEVRLCLGLLL